MKKKKQHPYCKARIAWRLNNAMAVLDLRDLLTMVSVDCPVDVLKARTDLERAQAEEWACQVHLSASDNPFMRIPPKPAWLDPYDVEDVGLYLT
jgi:hypothetical protein